MENAVVGLYNSAARTATPTPEQRTNESFSGVRIVIDCTAIVTAPSVVFNVEGFDPLSGKWYLVLASAAIVAVSTTVLYIAPGAPVTANLSANAVLPGTWRVRPVHANANSITYSVGAEVFAP